MAEGTWGVVTDSPLRQARLTIALLETLRELKASGRAPTAEERLAVGRFMGWGPLAPAFAARSEPPWRDINTQLYALLGPERFQTAQQAVTNSNFTDRPLADAIWTIATGLNFQGGRVFEAGGGTGAIPAAAPPGLDLSFLLVERDEFSAELAALRLPNADVLTQALEKTPIVNNSFDLAVGNVPFAATKIYDRALPKDPRLLEDRDEEGLQKTYQPRHNLKKPRMSTHNYFIWRTLKALRPGGVGVLITSRYTMDAKDPTDRRFFAEIANFVGAVRLPNGAHKAANTDVVTDIVVFQKPKDRIVKADYSWCSVAEPPGLPEELRVNRYFLEHPEAIVGTLGFRSGQYGPHELAITAPDDPLKGLHEAVTALVESGKQRERIWTPRPKPEVLGNDVLLEDEHGHKEGSFQIINNTVVQIVNRKAQPVTRYADQFRKLIQIRDAANTLLEAEIDLSRSEADLAPLRLTLRRAYNAYADKYGPINKSEAYTSRPRNSKKSLSTTPTETDALGDVDLDVEDDEEADAKILGEVIKRRRPHWITKFRDDPDCVAVLALDSFNIDTDTATTAAILERRVNVLQARPDSAGSADEALALCLDELGRLDLSRIGTLLSIDTDEVPTALGDLVFQDPATGTWIERSEYLSGDVRAKRDWAREAARDDPTRWQRNVIALEAVVPADLAPAAIRAKLGASWLPVSDIESFVAELIGGQVEVSHNNQYALWDLDVSRRGSEANVTFDWGTERVDAYEIIRKCLNNESIDVYDMINVGGTEKRVRNVNETLAAEAKRSAIQERFGQWLWENDERAERLAEHYNVLFRSEVARQFDGSHLTLPGCTLELEPHQKDLVWRIMCQPASLAHHCVGAGKTFAYVAAAMELKRLGLSPKTLITVPNSLLEQVCGDAKRLYPAAKILMVTKEDLRADRRKVFAARIATGDYDMIFTTHSCLGKLPMHPETEKRYIDEQIEELDQILLKRNQGTGRSMTTKRLEALRENKRQRQEELLDNHRDDGVNFEALGVTALFVDEAHLFKNLEIPTRVDGFSSGTSKRATGLEMMYRYLRERSDGKRVGAFFTATFPANSLMETYILMRYLDPEGLAKRGINTADAFIGDFVQFATRVEVSPDGRSMRTTRRPVGFENAPELQMMLSQFTDVRTKDMILQGKLPKVHKFPVVLEPSAAQVAYVDSLVERANALRKGSPMEMPRIDPEEPRFDNWVWLCSDGRAASVHPSLVGLTDDEAGKAEAFAANVLKHWKTPCPGTQGDGAEFANLQIGMCDQGTPHGSDARFYGRIRDLLIAGGMPAHGIKFVQDAKDDLSKAQLFSDCRRGKVAVILGSTETLGIGVNIQDRCIALHHLDAPWRPADIEQREGRIERRGNKFADVFIYKYVTQGTFDSYSWQTLERKAMFINQLLGIGLVERSIEEVAADVSEYSNMKAVTTGDPLLMEDATLALEIGKLTALANIHGTQVQAVSRKAREQRAWSMADASESLTWETIAERAQEHVPVFRINGRTITESSPFGKLIVPIADGLMRQRRKDSLSIGTYQGIPLTLTVQPMFGGTGFKFAVLFEDGSTDTTPAGVEIHTNWFTEGQEWRIADAISTAISTAGPKAIRLKNASTAALAQAQQFEQRRGAVFEHAEQLQWAVGRKEALLHLFELEASGDEAAPELRAQLLANARQVDEVFEDEIAIMEGQLAAVRALDSDVLAGDLSGLMDNSAAGPAGVTLTDGASRTLADEVREALDLDEPVRNEHHFSSASKRLASEPQLDNNGGALFGTDWTPVQKPINRRRGRPNNASKVAELADPALAPIDPALLLDPQLVPNSDSGELFATAHLRPKTIVGHKPRSRAAIIAEKARQIVLMKHSNAKTPAPETNGIANKPLNTHLRAILTDLSVDDGRYVAVAYSNNTGRRLLSRQGSDVSARIEAAELKHNNPDCEIAIVSKTSGRFVIYDSELSISAVVAPADVRLAPTQAAELHSEMLFI